MEWREVFLCFILMTSRVNASVSCTISNLERGIQVDCSNRRMTSFRTIWPSSVLIIDLSINNLTDVSGLLSPSFSELRHLDLSRNTLPFVPSQTLRHLKKLEWLDLSYNNLNVIPSDAFRDLDHLEFLALRQTSLANLTIGVFENLSRLLTLDLSRNSLTEIPTSALEHLSHLQSLNLGHNAISVVKNMTFVHMSHLLRLDLQSNALVMLNRDAFVGLGRLVDLDLSLNQLLLNNLVFLAGVFSPLIALQNLIMHGNDKRVAGQYPENVFIPLTSLSSLSIDTYYDSHFGTAFSTLTSMKSLDLSYNCKITTLTNLTFKGFHNSSLQNINLEQCKVTTYDKCAFCFLPRLQTLVLKKMKTLSVDDAFSLLHGLQYQKLSVVNIDGTRRPSALDVQNMASIQHVCIESLSMRKCHIYSISPAFLTLLYSSILGTCLKHFDISQNLLWDSATGVRISVNLFPLPKLESIQIQDQTTYSLRNACNYCQGRSAREIKETQDYRIATYVHLPKSLQYIDVSAISQIGVMPDFTFLSADSVTFLDLSYCGITRLDFVGSDAFFAASGVVALGTIRITTKLFTYLRGKDGKAVTLLWLRLPSYFPRFECDATISGLRNLETFDLSGNDCYEMSATFFHNMPSLKRLMLSNMKVDHDFLVSHAQDLLGGLRNLEKLDLSSNSLVRLPRNMLQGQTNLTDLFLAKNRFQSVPVEVAYYPSLRMLDLSGNIIPTLSPQEREVFNDLAARHTFQLRLKGNPISCACANMDFIYWLEITKVSLDGDNFNIEYDDDFDDNGRSYPCVTEEGEMLNTKTIHENALYYWRRCVGERIFWMALTGLCLQLLLTFALLLLARSWTYVLYVINVLRKLKIPKRQDFRKDAYIGYSDADEDLVLALCESLQIQRGVKLFLRYVEELPGSIKAENIVENVEDSWKVVILVTSNMTQDPWGAFTILQAQRSITDTMPDRVIIVFAEDPTRLPHMTSLQHLLRMIPERNVFHIPRGSPSDLPHWDALAEAILHNDR